jgi:hypothetical protein
MAESGERKQCGKIRALPFIVDEEIQRLSVDDSAKNPIFSPMRNVGIAQSQLYAWLCT